MYLLDQRAHKTVFDNTNFLQCTAFNLTLGKSRHISENNTKTGLKIVWRNVTLGQQTWKDFLERSRGILHVPVAFQDRIRCMDTADLYTP